MGCSASHIECLKLAIASGADHILVFEDDFEFLISPEEFQQLLQSIQEVKYDVVLLGYFFHSKNDIKNTTHPLLKKIEKSQTTSGYIVHRDYLPTLLNNYMQGLALLRAFHNKTNKFAIDIFWKRLQIVDNWYTFKKRPGKQRQSYSDIEGMVTNYKGI